MKKTLILLSVLLILGLFVSCKPEPESVKCTVTFKPEISSGVLTGKVIDADGQEVTQITVPNGAEISTSGSTITIGGIVYTAVANDGWTFNSFSLNPDSQTITADTTITVCFSQNQP